MKFSQKAWDSIKLQGIYCDFGQLNLLESQFQNMQKVGKTIS